jgi:hypothetical protein
MGKFLLGNRSDVSHAPELASTFRGRRVPQKTRALRSQSFES